MAKLITSALELRTVNVANRLYLAGATMVVGLALKGLGFDWSSATVILFAWLLSLSAWGAHDTNKFLALQAADQAKFDAERAAVNEKFHAAMADHVPNWSAARAQVLAESESLGEQIRSFDDPNRVTIH